MKINGCKKKCGFDGFIMVCVHSRQTKKNQQTTLLNESCTTSKCFVRSEHNRFEGKKNLENTRRMYFNKRQNKKGAHHFHVTCYEMNQKTLFCPFQRLPTYVPGGLTQFYEFSCQNGIFLNIVCELSLTLQTY